jgi:hypothetical protein
MTAPVGLRVGWEFLKPISVRCCAFRWSLWLAPHGWRRVALTVCLQSWFTLVTSSATICDCLPPTARLRPVNRLIARVRVPRVARLRGGLDTLCTDAFPMQQTGTRLCMLDEPLSGTTEHAARHNWSSQQPTHSKAAVLPGYAACFQSRLQVCLLMPSAAPIQPHLLAPEMLEASYTLT